MSSSSTNEPTLGGHLAPFVAPGWDLGHLALAPAGRPLVMGIINLTPDSFYPGSRHSGVESAVAKAVALVADGADLLDLGAASSRPGAEPISAQEEADRLLPILSAVKEATEVPLSVDTFQATVARQALDITPCAINDITAGGDHDMFGVVAQYQCGLVLMHMQGTPATMQAQPSYTDPVAEISAWLAKRAQMAEHAGVATSRIVVDPGIGFGKTVHHNLALLNRLQEVAAGRPHLLGVSRKGFVGEISGAKTDDRLPGSLAALVSAWRGGASVVRVHDVAETVQFLDVLRAIATGHP